jgi:hypothetical protein
MRNGGVVNKASETKRNRSDEVSREKPGYVTAQQTGMLLQCGVGANWMHTVAGEGRRRRARCSTNT